MEQISKSVVRQVCREVPADFDVEWSTENGMLETLWSERLQQSDLPFCNVVVDRQSRVASGPRVTPNRRPAWSYGLGAAACLLVCLVSYPWGIMLVWPAVGFCLLREPTCRPVQPCFANDRANSRVALDCSSLRT